MNNRTKSDKILNSKDDSYMFCPNCGDMNMYRDLRDKVNSCHGCGFTHFVGVQTVKSALADIDKSEGR